MLPFFCTFLPVCAAPAAGYAAAASCEQLGLSLDEYEVCLY